MDNKEPGRLFQISSYQKVLVSGWHSYQGEENPHRGVPKQKTRLRY